MVVTLEDSKKEGYRPTLKFKALVDDEYLIVSKVFDEPKKGTSDYGEWHLYTLKLHEYDKIDMKAMTRKVVKVEEECTYFTGPSTRDDGSTYEGTICKVLANAAVGEKLKITMVDGEKQRKYEVETFDGDTSAPSVPEPVKVEEGLPVAAKTMISGLKTAGQTVDVIVTSIKAAFPEIDEKDIVNEFAGGVQ